MFLPQGELFKNIMGEDWDKLHPDIKARFSTQGQARTSVFKGTLHRMQSSLFGKALAWLTMPLLKGALVPFTEDNLFMEFRMGVEPGRAYFEKQRLYHFTDRKLICFSSTMHTDAQGEAWEAVGKGIGMKLRFGEVNGDLTIDSKGYFWEVLGMRFAIPDWLSPGIMYLQHINEAGENFRIRINIVHPLFGTTFFQEGVFTLDHIQRVKEPVRIKPLVRCAI